MIPLVKVCILNQRNAFPLQMLSCPICVSICKQISKQFLSLVLWWSIMIASNLFTLSFLSFVQMTGDMFCKAAPWCEWYGGGGKEAWNSTSIIWMLAIKHTVSLTLVSVFPASQITYLHFISLCHSDLWTVLLEIMINENLSVFFFSCSTRIFVLNWLWRAITG